MNITMRSLGVVGGILSLLMALFCAKYFMISKNDDADDIAATISPENEPNMKEKLSRVEPIRVSTLNSNMSS